MLLGLAEGYFLIWKPIKSSPPIRIEDRTNHEACRSEVSKPYYLVASRLHNSFALCIQLACKAAICTIRDHFSVWHSAKCVAALLLRSTRSTPLTVEAILHRNELTSSMFDSLRGDDPTAIRHRPDVHN